MTTKGRANIGERCIVVCPRHAFILPWIRSYFANGNDIPLVIVTGPKGDWDDKDHEYCRKAAEFSGGIVLDCSDAWERAESLKERAVLPRIGWYSKRLILIEVAKRIAPKSWAWIDDDAEVTGNLDECFDYAERAPGFILTQFYCPSSIDNMHPESFFRSDIDTGDKIAWNSFMFFHGDANRRIAEDLDREFAVEDDEIAFCDLYKSDERWHDGFVDFSIREWQANCKSKDQVPENWSGKVLHYTSYANGGEVKRAWAAKAESMPRAPFEDAVKDLEEDDEGPVDAVFVIGTGSIDNNEELRYALRNLDANCKFVRDVYICGFCPNWVDKSVVKHLNWPDRFSHAKDANIIDKLRHACEHEGIAKRILFCSDDQFQTHPCKWEDFYPRYLRRFEKGDRWYDDKRRVWHARLRKTLERDLKRREEAGLNVHDVFYYQPHIWMQIDRDKFINYAKWCNYETRDDTIIASGYFNFIDAGGKPDGDHVFLGRGVSRAPRATHVAYHDGSYKAAIGILRDMFPYKCRFEVGFRPKTQVSGSEPFPYAPGEPMPEIVSPTLNMDPSAAKKDEISNLMGVMDKIRSNHVWSGLLGEISRAEELRLFGVRGWRVVWGDIIRRWREDTRDGQDQVTVETPRSSDAAMILNSYMSNPESMRTIRFGAPQAGTSRRVPSFGRQMPRTPPDEVIESLRKRVRSSLRRIGE